jgi:hypothetical protein
VVDSPGVINGGGATDHLDAPSRRSTFILLHAWRAATVIAPIGREMHCREAT